MVPYDQKESIQTLMQIDGNEEIRKPSKKIEVLLGEVEEWIKTKPSSLPAREKTVEMIHIFEEEIARLEKRSLKKIEVEGKEIKNLNI